MGNLLQSVLMFLILANQTNAAPDPAMEIPTIVRSPGAEYADRPFQGIPGLERAPGGRLWATWYGGGPDEGPENYVMLVTSGNDGATWSELALVIDPQDKVRAFDPCLWLDPRGTLWLFWAQAYGFWDGRAGVWAITTANPDAERPEWSAPRRLCDGIMMNKPTVLSSGEWLLPAAVWNLKPDTRDGQHVHDLGPAGGSNVICSTDQGATWAMRGQAQVPERRCDEHMLVEKRDGSLWMLVRTAYGIGESVSKDKGKTWSEGRPCATVTHIPAARFFIRRLDSGNLLLVKNNPPDGKTRSHLTAYLSEDDGVTWLGGLVLDDRAGVSYPDGFQAPDGRIYIVHDRNRKADREILMAVFSEEDIRSGAMKSPGTRTRVVVNRAG